MVKFLVLSSIDRIAVVQGKVVFVTQSGGSGWLVLSRIVVNEPQA